MMTHMCDKMTISLGTSRRLSFVFFPLIIVFQLFGLCIYF